ncbi:MAG: hypothetical protein ABWY92_01955, partial [Xanthobacteraceae bacterium]
GVAICGGRRVVTDESPSSPISVAGHRLPSRLRAVVGVSRSRTVSCTAFSQYWPSWRLCLAPPTRARCCFGPWARGPPSASKVTATTIHMAFGPDLPRPDWVPVYPGAVVIHAGRLTSSTMPSGFHSLDLATRASFEDVKRFYTDRLTAAGFAVVDNGVGPLNPLTAAYLGIAGSLSGRRVATDDQIEIMIRTPDGLIPSRALELRWRKISETPVAAAGQQ